MISALTGELRRVDEDRIHLQAGAMLYELMVPAADVAELRSSVGQSLTLYTIFYLEGDAARGNLEPRLIGFLREEDRRFFDRFTTVKGIGVRTALKALTEPVGRIAQAIEARDTRFLIGLKGIGKRSAELIVAELAGKVKEFALQYAAGSGARPIRRTAEEEDALAACAALGIQRPEAERLLDRVKQEKPQFVATDELLREMLRVRTVRV
jgi:Holliday junction DNA helicase RuvA